MRKLRSNHSCIELSKTQFFRLNIVNLEISKIKKKKKSSFILNLWCFLSYLITSEPIKNQFVPLLTR